MIDGTMRNYVVKWRFRFVELQHGDGLDALPLSLSNFTFHDFKLCCGSTWILCKAHSKVCDFDAKKILVGGLSWQTMEGLLHYQF
jgi:hypothetical protein